MDKNEEAESAAHPEAPANVNMFKEEPHLRYFINANVIVCLSAAVFLFAYFA